MFAYLQVSFTGVCLPCLATSPTLEFYAPRYPCAGLLHVRAFRVSETIGELPLLVVCWPHQPAALSVGNEDSRIDSPPTTEVSKAHECCSSPRHAARAPFAGAPRNLDWDLSQGRRVSIVSAAMYLAALNFGGYIQRGFSRVCRVCVSGA